MNIKFPANLLCCVVLSASNYVFAQSYPSKPVRLLSYSGAAIETLMRVIGREMQNGWGQPLIIENRPGANGIIAGEACAHAPADGHTLCMVDRTFLSLPQTADQVPFDVYKDFAPVTNIVYPVLALAVHPSAGANSFGELIAAAKKRPGELNLASLGWGTLPNLLRVWMQKEYGISTMQIPYKNPGALMGAMLAGETHFTYFGVANFTQHHATGKLRVIATSGAQRSPLLPEVPTMFEQGVSVDMRVWFGWFAPVGTTREVRERIHREVQRVVNSPDFREKNFTQQAMEVIGQGPDDFAAFIRKDAQTTAELLKLLGAKPE